MKTLFIDTHLSDINIILFENNNIIREQHVIGEKYNSKFLMPSIRDVINGEKYDQIVVVNGPGSFTGVRLGVTVAKTLAYTQNIMIKVISSLDIMNICCEDADHICAISDGNGFFIGEYSNYNKINEYYYLSNADYQQFSKNHNIITDVAIDYIKVFNYLTNVDSINPHSVKPIYIKKIGVEL